MCDKQHVYVCVCVHARYRHTVYAMWSRYKFDDTDDDDKV